MHLILSNSQDATANMIVDGLGNNVIRLNNDRHEDHEIQINNKGFSISDKFGRRVTNENLKTLILRKFSPRPDNVSDEELYAFREYSRALESLLEWVCWDSPKKVPINIFRIRQISKFNMAAIAEKYFFVPKWAFTTKPSNSGLSNAVLKNLCGLPFKEAKIPEESSSFVFVQPVELDELADGWPWYLQEKVDAKLDLTVAYIGGKTFGLKLNRGTFEGMDWRKYIGTEVDANWELVTIPTELNNKIDAYMKELKLDYGRLDFLADDDTLKNITFLEVNPHGQWGWMDLNKNNGIYAAMMEFLTTPRKI
jgi:hypothetical protein